jgi:pyruvate formate lyase activating enzyme
MMDATDHEEYTGVSNDIICGNLKELVSSGEAVEIRIPLVCDVNDSESNIRQTVQYLIELKHIQGISLLPYHKGGCEKHIRLRKGEKLKNFKPSSKERLRQIEQSFLEAGFSVKIGG